MGDVRLTRRLLILACSQRKRTDPIMLPALERYDGPFFRVLRRYLRSWAADQHGRPPPDTYILSAEFGLIPGDKPIPFYERRMTAERAEQLRPNVLNTMQELLDRANPYRELCMCLGREYRRALAGWEIWRPNVLTVFQTEGSLGAQQSQLHEWLHGSPRVVSIPAHNGVVRVRGVEVSYTASEVLELAQNALSRDGKGAANFKNWYVQLGDQRVSPKWLVSQLTGLPVSAFVTDDARRVLAQLGIEVKRT